MGGDVEELALQLLEVAAPPRFFGEVAHGRVMAEAEPDEVRQRGELLDVTVVEAVWSALDLEHADHAVLGTDRNHREGRRVPCSRSVPRSR